MVIGESCAGTGTIRQRGGDDVLALFCLAGGESAAC